MKTFLIFLGILVGGWCAGTDAEPAPTIALALTLNDAVTTTVYREWPLIVRGDVVLMDDVSAPVGDDIRSVELKIVAASGATSPWPFKRAVDPEPVPPLGPGNEAYQTAWFLTAEQTRGLSLGTYEMSLVWRDRKSPTLRLKVEDAPAGLSPNDEIRKARITSRVALLTGDMTTGLAALTQAVARDPSSAGLWLSIAQLYERQGNYSAGLDACQEALELILQKNPNMTEPPTDVMQVQARLVKALLKTSPLRSSPAKSAASAPAISPAVPVATPIAIPPMTSQQVAAVPTPTSSSPAAPAQSSSPAVGVVVSAKELTDEKVSTDASGQWAASAVASSQYSSPGYSATQATGAANIPLGMAGDNQDAWCPAKKDNGEEWLEVSFAKPVSATEVRVRQNNCPGAIVKIEAIEADGTTHVWWEGVDAYKPSAVREIVWFAVRVPKTSYLVAKVKINLNLAVVPGWKQIDAVQLVGTAP